MRPAQKSETRNPKSEIEIGGSTSRQAFALIELLVVIGLLGALAALLLPAFTRGKKSAQAVKCANNLHQLGLAAQMYWDDNGGRTFYYRTGPTNGGWTYWFGWLQNGPEETRAFDASAGALYPYMRGRGVELCPALNYSSGNFKFKASGAAYGYGYNWFLALPAPATMTRLNHHSTTALLADAAQVNTFQAPASPAHPMLEEFYYISSTEATTHFRHDKTAEVLFCDGHVAREKPADGSLDDRLPGEIIGYMRKEILVP